MNCGVPFCQAGTVFEGKPLGCPLHNLIPEWNDMLRKGNRRHALSRLLKTNCFPEFTGRVCPAFCQKACILGMNGEPVSIRENELDIIEYGFETGLVVPQPPAVRSGKTVAVIGSGPAGLAAAFYLNRRGHLITVYERSAEPGGLLLYGISEEKLPKRIVRRRTAFLEREGIVFRTGEDIGNGIDPEKLGTEYDCVVRCAGREGRKETSLVVLAIAEGKQKAADADRSLMGYTTIE